MRRTNDKTLTVGAVLLSIIVGTHVSVAQQAARIDTVSPAQAAAGQIVTITGGGFGGRNVRITVGATAADVVSATGSRVSFVVPGGVACGPTVIRATNPGGHSGQIAFSACALVNLAPVVDAGPDLTVMSPNAASLKGSVTDDGRPASPPSVHWKKVKGPGTVTLTSATSASTTASFSAPGQYVLQLVASDSELTVSDEATIEVKPANRPPVANAGPDQTVPVATTVTLDATGSTDMDGDALLYEWAIKSAPAGSAASLSDPSAVQPTFVVDEPGSYVLQLVVHDGAYASEPATVVVSTVNSAPVANAGRDQTAFVTRTVTLNGEHSSDVDGDPLSFNWTLVSAPDGSSAVLANPTSVTPTFVVDKSGVYVARLTVNDGTAASTPDTVTITTENSAPIANAGPDQSRLVIQTVTLDGNGSTDVDGDPLTYAWSLVSVPAGSSASLSDPTAIAPTFVTDRPGTYVAQLIVSEPNAVSTPDTVTITTLNSAPVANAGLDLTVVAGQAAFLSGLESSDVDGDPLTFQWSLTSVPPGSAAVLVNSSSASPSFIVDRPGTFVAQLIVNDGTVNSTPDTVMINTTNSVPVANAGPDQLNVRAGTGVTLDGFLSNDADGHTLTHSWSLTAKPAASAAVLSDPTAIGPSFTADVAGDYVAQLIVNDGFSNSPPDTVLIRAAEPLHLEIINAGAAATMTSGFSFPLTIQLESPAGTPVAAPAGGLPVTIVASNAACVAAPASGAVVAEGTTTAIAPIAYGGTAPLPCTSTVTVTGPTGVTGDSLTMTVNPAPPITVPTSSVGGGLQTASLNGVLGDANHGGVTVHLVSSDPSRVLLAANAFSIGAASIDIPVANGAGTFSYYVHGMDWVDGVSSAAPVTVTASATGFSTGSGTINYVRAVLDVINVPTSTTSLSANIDFVVRVGVPGTANTMQTLQARRFGAPALAVTVSNSNAAIAEIDHNGGIDGVQAQTSAIAAGQFTTPNDSAGGFEFDPYGVGSTTVTASIPGFTTLTAGTVDVSVSGPGIAMFGTFSLGAGLQQGPLQGTLGASQHGGVTVRIASTDPARVKIAANATTAGSDAIDVPVANGATSFVFYVQGADWVPGASSASPVAVTASATGFSNGTGSVNYVQPALDIINLSAQTTSLSANTDFVVRIGAPNALGTTMQTLQARRFGAPALIVTASNGNATVAEIDHNGGVDGAQTQTSTIAPGQSSTPNNLAGGFEFDPLGVGSTTVTASIPGFITLSGGVQTVTATGASITMPSATTIGGGLQTGFFQGNLGAANHGGVVVRVQSSDPARILIAPNGTSLGAASIDIAVANGATSFVFFLQGTDWVDGVSSAQAVIVTATAAGFSQGASTVNYVRPVLDIINLPSATTSLSTNTAFIARVGVPNAANTMQTLQARRFGAAPLVVTVTNSNAGTAEIDQTGGLNGAQVQTASIAAGQSGTPNGFGGGFEFDPFGTGSTTVHASVPNFLSLPAATVNVNVSTPAIALPPLEAIAGGLMYGAYSGTLAGSQHGGVQVRLVSSDPSRVLLAATSTSPGAAAIDITVANGVAAFNFFVVGADWVDGVSSSATVIVTATANGFTSEGEPITYVRPVFDVANLPASVSAVSANRDFNIRVGIPNATNTGLRLLQWRRAGASDLVVTVTNSNAGVAEVDQNGGLNGAQVQTARIVAGQSSTPFNASGGLEFDPAAAGSTVLTATIPGFAMVPAAGLALNVTP
jgi:hypothetical protein